MKIGFNNINFIKNVSVDRTTPSFRAQNYELDKYVKSGKRVTAEIADNIAEALSDEFIYSDEFKDISEDQKLRVREGIVLTAILDLLSTKETSKLLRREGTITPLNEFTTLTFPNKLVSDILVKTFAKANLKTAGDLGETLSFYKNPRIKNVYDGLFVDFFEVFGAVKNKDDILAYPELLLCLNQIALEKNEENLPDFLETFISFLKDLKIDKEEDFRKKFSYLAPKFNNFESPYDTCDAIVDVAKNYDDKIYMLSQFCEQHGNNKKLNNPEHVYATNPAIVDTFYESNGGKNLDGIEDYIETAVSAGDFKKKQRSLVAPYFNNFESPLDELRFYKMLNKNNLSVDNFNKLFSRVVVTDIEPISLIFNMENITSLITDKNLKDKNSAKSFYYNFADLLNVAYSSEETDFDVLSETFSLINNCKFKNSDDFINFYNRCNSNNKPVKTINSDELVDFIDLMRFVDKSEISNPKQKHNIRIENLRNIREDYNKIKDSIEKFLLNDSKNLFLSETSLSIFNKYGKDLIGCDEESIVLKLTELDKFNIKDVEQYNRKNIEMERFERFFPSRKELVNFIIKNQITFENDNDSKEYRDNCLKILDILYKHTDKKQSNELINKLSNSKFLIMSANSLPKIIRDNSSSYSTNKLITALINRNLRNYNSFEKFCQKYDADKNSLPKIIDYITNLPEGVSFAHFQDKLENLEKLISYSNYPLTLNIDNILNLSFEDFTNMKNPDRNINPKILNKLLGLPENINPVVKLPYAFNIVNNYANKTKISYELFNIEKGSEGYPKLKKFLFGIKEDDNEVPMSKIKEYSYKIPFQLVDLLNHMPKMCDKNEYNLSLHSRLRIVERFLMDDIHSDNDFCDDKIEQKVQKLLNSIYNQEQISIKRANKPDLFLANSVYDGTVIESVFGKDGRLVTVVEKSY